MRIMIISAANNIHTVRWVNELSDRGNEVHLAYLPNHAPSVFKISKKVALHQLSFKGPAGYYLNALSLASIHRLISPDITNVHYATGYATLSRLSGIKVDVLTVWGSDVYSFPRKSLIHKSIFKKNVKNASIITSSSQCMAEELLSIVPAVEDVEIVPFGVDLSLFKASRKKVFDRDEIVIGNIKTLKPNYKIDVLIESFAILRGMLDARLKHKVKLRIYGGGPQKNELQNLINSLQIADDVTLCGKIPNSEVPRILDEIDVFCVTSEHESFGVALVEAMATNTPAVASDVDGFREVIGESGAGYLVPPNQPELFAAALKRVIEDTSLASRMGDAGRNRVESYFDWDKNVDSMERLYARLIPTQDSIESPVGRD